MADALVEELRERLLRQLADPSTGSTKAQEIKSKLEILEANRNSE